MIDWNPYLEALGNHYAQWWKVYTLTDVVGRQRVEVESPLLLDFMVEMVQPAKEQPGEAQQKTERLGVLEGLRKYAADHVLLVGRPGSGKSTALARLLLEEAQASREINSLADSRIPVLVELRYYQTSVLDLIRDFLKQHGLFLNTSEIERLLFEKRFLLLVDGINELPSEAARRDLKAFRQTNAATPMIFTTRDLEVGGDLDIAKKLEMQPLSEAQMQQFVCAYLPEQGEQMLRQMGSRLREFGQTPLLLWMLCSLFRAMGKVPPNLGLVFRQFALSYDRKLKQDIPISKESRRWWHRLLEHLAWVMTSGEEKTELQVAIPRQQAEAVLTEFLAGKVAHSEDCALRCLEDLLNHHLILLGAGDQIEFRHQLIQEYYTAESLLKLLPSLSDDELKREYLNYLKWTEPLALMLELVKDEAQAVRVVKLALQVDLRLGARLAGAVKPQWQEQTVRLVSGLAIPQLLKIQLLLWEITTSDQAIPEFVKGLNDEDSSVRWMAAYALGKIGSDAAIDGLVKALNDEDSSDRRMVAEALGQIGSDAAINELVKALNEEDDYWMVAKALGQIGSDAAINELIKTLKNEADSDSVRSRAAEALGQIGSYTATNELVKALNDEDSFVRKIAAEALGQIGSNAAINELVKALNDEDYFVRRSATEALGKIGSDAAINELVKALNDEKSSVRRSAADALGKIGSDAAINELVKALNDEDDSVRRMAADTLGKIGSDTTINELVKALNDEKSSVRGSVVNALGKIGSDAATNELVKTLNDEKSSVRRSAADALGKIGSDAATNELVKALNDEDYFVRRMAADALGKIGSDAATNELVKALNHKDSSVRRSAAEALSNIGSDAAINELVKALNHKDSSIRWMAAHALGKIGSDAAINELVKALNDENDSVRSRAAEALGKIGSDAAIPELVKALNDENDSVRRSAAEALGKIASPALLPDLFLRLKTDKETKLLSTISAIQERCKFYNYTLTQSSSASSLQCSEIPSTPLKKGGDVQSISIKLMHILHLSDLHFGTLDQANLWSNQLASDLYNDLSIPHLDALILSGDIANYSTQEEYKAAEQFLHNLRQDFPLNPDQIVLVPGNHDLNWKLAKKAYQLLDRDDYDGELTDYNHIKVDETVIRVRDEAEYKQRFAHFSQFYETIKQKPYHLDYDQQYTLDHLPEQNLLILGLNSAWQLDHHYKTRASINTNALSNALTQIRRNPDYKNCLKIAVWHHPLDSAYSDRITDQGFLEQLAVNGFRLFLHGHIHKAETSLYRYDMSTNGRKLDRICAGTFGAPVREWVPGYPLQYNLLKIADNNLTVYTRRREELNGAWKPDARWLQGAGKTPLDYYAIAL